MGCVGSKQAGTYYESMLRKIILYTKTKYKTLSGDLNKQQQIIDELALDDIGLFITSILHNKQRQIRIEKVPAAGREVAISSPRSVGHFMKFIYQLFGWPLTTAVIDLSLHEPVSSQLVTSIIFALNTIDVCRTINFAKQKIDNVQSGLLAAYIANSINLQFLSLVGCQLSAKSTNDIAEGLLRLARKRVKLEEIGRCDDITINEQEAFLYEVPKYMPVRHGLFGIDLSRNKIGDVPCSRIIDSLTNHVDLEFLGMAETGFGEEASKALYEIIHNIKQLKYIDLSGNEEFNDKCLGLLFKKLQKTNFNVQFCLLSNTKVTAKYEQKFCKLLNRNQAVKQAYDDLLTGAFIRIFNTGEMAGECHGKGSDNYVEYCTSEYFPQLTNEENEIIQKIFKFITIQEGYVKQIAKILVEHKNQVLSNSTGPAIEDFTISLSETIGRRPEMEDVITIQSDFQEYRTKREGKVYTANEHYEILICLFDGHGGVDATQQAGNLFPACFADTVSAIMKAMGYKFAYLLPEKLWDPLMYSVFQRCDETLRQRQTPSGSTGVVCFILENLVVTANVGDSRAILIREEGSARRAQTGSTRTSVTNNSTRVGDIKRSDSANIEESQKIFSSISVAQTQICDSCKELNFNDYFTNKTYDENVNTNINMSDIVLRLSKDHKPDLPEEKRRVESVGGYVHQGRILSTLAVARGLGDFTYKPSVSNSPYVFTYRLQKQDAWLIICCDGVWDVLSDLDAALLVHRSMTAGVAAITLRDEAFRLDSGDNISSVAMRLFLK